MSLNSDMDRYLRQKRRAKAFDFVNQREPSLWERLFNPKPKGLVHEELTPEESAKLNAMEKDLKKGEAKLETATPEQEHDLAEMQEERVSLYTKFTRLFQRQHKVDEEYEQLQTAQPVPDTSVTEDFRTLAQIQMRWLERMPSRVKEEFKDSEDYHKYAEILQRRGVAKKK